MENAPYAFTRNSGRSSDVAVRKQFDFPMLHDVVLQSLRGNLTNWEFSNRANLREYS